MYCYLKLLRGFIGYAIFWLLFINCASAQSISEEKLFRATGKLYTEVAADSLVKQGKLASTAATAMVPLVFDRNGHLLTARQFNDLIDKNAWDAELYQNFFTDFTTYREVLRRAQTLGLQPRARVNLVRDYRYVTPPPDPKYSGPYLFDPFQTYYQTWEETEKDIARKTRQQTP